ncbi:MAG: hypothetical protein R8K46_01880 [Mariprofundaceae bacterium]
MNKELLLQAARVLTPVGVFLRTTTIHVDSKFQPRHGKSDLKVEYKARHLSEYNLLLDEDEKTGVVSFQYEAGVRLVDDEIDEAGDDYVKVEIIAVFASEYQLSEAAAFDEDAMSEFLNHNVRHHVWPYWREYLQSTCTRMGLPVIPVPH